MVLHKKRDVEDSKTAGNKVKIYLMAEELAARARELAKLAAELNLEMRKKGHNGV